MYGDDYYKGKDGKTHYEVGKLSSQEMKDQNYIKHLGEEISGRTDKGLGVFGDSKGNITQSLSEVTIRSGKNSSVLGFGASGDYNIMQAANMDIGRDDATRRRIDELQRGMVIGVWAGLAAPVAIVAGAEASLGAAARWLGQRIIANAAGGTADLAYQLATKDAKDINASSIIGNYTMGPFSSAAVGYTFNLSSDAIRNNEILSNPFTKKGLISIGIGTITNYGAGKAGNLLGVPRLRVGSSNMPNVFGPALNIGTNAAGNAVGEAVTNKLTP